MPTYKYPKYIFVTGGVISGIGKGIATSTIAYLLKDHGFKVSVVKVDMYLNVDAGTINPMEHGEVFVTEDGIETDQDLGNYERFLNQNLLKHNYMTMGQVYYDVITKERHFGYAGQDVEGHIHIPQEIMRRLDEVAKKDGAEILFVEVGGTVGEYQNMLFFETIRKMKQKSPDNVFLIHLAYLPKPEYLGEVKSKPVQSSIYDLYKLGLHPDMVLCRSKDGIDKNKSKTISFNTGVDEKNIISAPDVDFVYRVPVNFINERVDKKMLRIMRLHSRKKPENKWQVLMKKVEGSKKPVKVAIAGKYFNFGNSVLEDAYICVIEAIKHASWTLGAKPHIQWFDVERFEKSASEQKKFRNELLEYNGIIVPQGWGSRGVEGKIKTVQLAREQKIPYLGLCFGMQMAVIEYARNVLGLKDANSEEVNPKTQNPVIHIMPDQKEYLAKSNYGGTIRLGAWPCKLDSDSMIYKAYKNYSPDRLDKNNLIMERHRHRYEFNNEYRQRLVDAGLVISGVSPDGHLVEAVELSRKVHPFFVGTQFHPEYKSRPLDPHPIFVEFIKACLT